MMDDDHVKEREMRDSDAPTFDNIDELSRYIEGLVTQEHDYGTCVYAMSLSAVAAFNYIARKLGVTGFQASCADLDILRRTRRMEGPFKIIDGENALYPQYDIMGEVSAWLDGDDMRKWCKKQAQKKLDEGTGATRSVKDHWERLASAKID